MYDREKGEWEKRLKKPDKKKVYRKKCQILSSAPNYKRSKQGKLNGAHCAV